MGKTFRYELGREVKLQMSDERGIVVARAEYLNSEDSYLVRYRAGDGRQVQDWWEESAIEG